MKDPNDSSTDDIFGKEPMITALGGVSCKLKESKEKANRIEITIKGVTNITDTAMMKTPVWSLAVAEWLIRICEEDFNAAERVVKKQAPQLDDDNAESKAALDSTGLTSVKIIGADVIAVFACDTAMSDLMRLSDAHIKSMVARWLVALCCGDVDDALVYLRDGYLRLANEEQPRATAKIVRFK
jgi:hypothetical protein